MSAEITVTLFDGKPGPYAGIRERYERLIHRYASVEVRYEIPFFSDTAHSAMVEKKLAAIGKTWRPPVYPVVLAEEGATMESAAFAAWLRRHRDAGRRLHLYVGGAWGLPEEFKRSCRERISLSPMTFAHELAMVMLLEQLYRAFTILSGHPYHK